MGTLVQRFSPRTETKLGIDEERRLRLFLGLSLLGLIFGSAFEGFYLVIGHFWGALIIAVTALGVLLEGFRSGKR